MAGFVEAAAVDAKLVSQVLGVKGGRLILVRFLDFISFTLLHFRPLHQSLFAYLSLRFSS